MNLKVRVRGDIYTVYLVSNANEIALCSDVNINYALGRAYDDLSVLAEDAYDMRYSGNACSCVRCKRERVCCT